MLLKDNLEIRTEDVIANLERLTNQIFKILPIREELGNWQSALDSVLIELKGVSALFENQKDIFLLLCKLEGVKDLDKEEDFIIFRKTIFESLSLLAEIKKCLKD